MSAADGGPAFPASRREPVFIEELGRYDDRLGPPEGGMSLRDYFAAQVLGGMWMQAAVEQPERAAALAYLWADAMLAERAK